MDSTAYPGVGPELYRDIAERTQGDIYMGVVGPVRTGKSTFIKRFMELMVLGGLESDTPAGASRTQRIIDELPHSGAGRTIMTTQPRFIPDEAAEIVLPDDTRLRVRLVDCVGYMVRGALGTSEGDARRMVRTPWFDHDIPFDQAAELGTRKVITEHSTLGIVVTTDGSITDIPRAAYEEPEERVINELKQLGKPFAVVLNCAQDPFDEAEVRRALALVLDRNALAEAAGIHARAAEGVVSPGVPDSGGGTFREDGALLNNDPDDYPDACAQGLELLSQAGYDGGRGLGELEYLYVDQGNAAAVAQALCDMWNQQLDLQVTARAVTEEELAQALTEGTYTLAGVELRPVANDPECFLMPWVSERTENITRYSNSAYDTLLSIIASAQDSTARQRLPP